MSTDPKAAPRALPDRPSIRQLKDQAKDLVKAGAASSITDAQFKIARLYGFASWPKLKAHIDSLEEIGQLKQAIDTNDIDRVMTMMTRNPTLHYTPPPHPTLRELPPNLGRYMLRAVGISALQRDDFGYLFVKVARINIFGTVVAGSQRRLWKNSKLHASGGWRGGADVVTPNWVPSVFMDGAELDEATFDGLSPQQKRRSNARALRTDVDRVGKRAYQKPFE
jgi:hypothetical protein